MEQFVLNLLHAAGWIFLFIFLFAIIGFVATIRWIVAMFVRGEHAVESGVQGIENLTHRK